MTREGEIVILREHVATFERLADRMTEMRRRLNSLMPISADRLKMLSGDEHINILAFLKVFEQFEDAIGRTLKTIAMLMQLGKSERLTQRDVALRAVSLGILDDGKAWADAVRTRNELAHEYPLDQNKQANQVNAAWDHSETLFATAHAISQFIERERLLHGDL